VDGGAIYAGGGFTIIGGQTRNNVAALDATTGAADPAWNPNASAPVLALAVAGSTVYAGGGFTSIGGGPQPYLAAIISSTVDVPRPELEALSLTLGSTMPSPVHWRARIRFILPSQGCATLKIYDVAGRQVASLLDGKVMTAGAHDVDLETRGWRSGCYFYRLSTLGMSRTRMMVVIP
jgi:hypothetical protein